MSGNPMVKLALRALVVLAVFSIALGLGVWGLLARGCQPLLNASGCAVVSLSPATLTADFYQGDQLVAASTSTANIAVAPGQVARIDVRNIKSNRPEAGEAYAYGDTFVEVLVPSLWPQTYVVSPQKLYQQGLLSLTCAISGARIGDQVACQPVIDGATQPNLHDGETASYPLDIGAHSLHVDVAGAQASNWLADDGDQALDITGGETTALNATFAKKTLLTITLGQPAVVGDLFLDGRRVGDQVASAQEWVKPNTSYEIIGSSFADPAAQGLYRWKTIGIGVDVGSEAEKTVTLPMSKQDLTGLAKISCQIADLQPSESLGCDIPVDNGDPILHLNAQQSAEIKLKPGVHNLSVRLIGPNVSKWVTPAPRQITVHTGQTTSVAFSVVLVPVKPTPLPTLPPAPPQAAPAAPVQGPTLSGFGANARAIFLRGQAMGRDPHRFSKVGDCETDSPFFLIPLDDGTYNVGDYTQLKPVITFFAGSFKYQSQAGRGSFVVSSVLDPQWSDPGVCQPGETPLACEYRSHNPAIALIMLRTYPYPWQNQQRSQYVQDMRTVISYTIDQGIVPVVSTIPLIESSPDELMDMNNIVRQLAAEYNIPLWDFYATTSRLPNNGVKNSHLTLSPDGSTFFNLPDSLQYGMTQRNLEALEALYAVYNNVMR